MHSNEPIDGKLIILIGDFWQILSVATGINRGDVVKNTVSAVSYKKFSEV